MAPTFQLSPTLVTICNRTDESLFAISEAFESEKSDCLVSIPPRRKICHSCQLPDHQRNASYTPTSISILDRSNNVIAELAIPLVRYGVAQRSSSEAIWKPMYTNERLTQRRYRILLRHLHSYESPPIELLILPIRNRASFLSCIDDDACLTSLSIPGTHESLALYGWPISTCQASQASITQQLDDGVRYLDIRLAPKGYSGKERLLAYHGVTDERIEFGKVLEECFDFLDGSGSNETIIMSIKQESGEQDLFIRLLFEEYVKKGRASANGQLDRGMDRWFLEDRVPKLGEVRGKIIMLSRFVIAKEYEYSGGISPPIWPNSFKGTFEYQLRGSHQQVQTQDWYDIGYLSSIPAKMNYIKQLCQDSGRLEDVLSLNYCNGSSFPWALPPAVAKGFLHDGSKLHHEMAILPRVMATQGVNTLLRTYVADALFSHDPSSRLTSSAIEQLRVTWAIDYYNEPTGAQDLVALLIEANF